MNPIGVIIARFQSPYLHQGHRSIIESVIRNHNKTVIILGVSPVKGSRRDPLDFQTREKMIRASYPNVIILPLPNHPLDSKWSLNLDASLSDSFPGSKFRLYGSRDSFIPYYSGRFEVVELPETGSHSATIIREQISDKVLDSEEFRTGVIYAYSNMYDKVYPTVDMAVFRDSKKEILLGRKDIDNKWRLLGGFTDPTDNSFEEAARRELREECGPIEISSVQYEHSVRVDDWRYRNEADKIITTLFSSDFISGEPKGSDDIAEVKWFVLNNLEAMMQQGLTAAEHTPHFTHLLKKYLH
jgi:bifunctional NMN adenylyltransferase/nudix hydrolase